MLLLWSADFYKLSLSKNYFRSTIRVAKGLDSDQDRCSGGPDLGPNCLLRLSADKKVIQANKKLILFILIIIIL